MAVSHHVHHGRWDCASPTTNDELTQHCSGKTRIAQARMFCAQMFLHLKVQGCNCTHWLPWLLSLRLACWLAEDITRDLCCIVGNVDLLCQYKMCIHHAGIRLALYKHSDKSWCGMQLNDPSGDFKCWKLHVHLALQAHICDLSNHKSHAS